MANEEPDPMSEAVDAWLKLSPEERLKTNTAYKRQYDEANEVAGKTEWTSWEDLTHDQRVEVQRECIRYAQELQDFGSSLRRGY